MAASTFNNSDQKMCWTIKKVHIKAGDPIIQNILCDQILHVAVLTRSETLLHVFWDIIFSRCLEGQEH